MNKDLKKLISETIKTVFAEAPEKLIERGTREIQYDICPHCKQEIYEKHDYSEDGGRTWRHSDCKGLIARPETPIEKINDWLRPYVKEARIQRNAAKKAMSGEDLMPGVRDANTTDGLKQLGNGGFPGGGPASGDEDNETRVDNVMESEAVPGMPPSGEEKYNKQEPGGTMMAVNTTNLSTEAAMSKNENEESKVVGPRDYARFMDDMLNFVNASNVPLRVTITEISVTPDEVHSVNTYIIRVDNG